MNVRWALACAAVWMSGNIAASAAIIQFQEDISPSGAYQAKSVGIRSNAAYPGTAVDGGTMQVGRTVTAGDFLRGIVGFDLSAIPAGSTINSVTLTVSPRQNDATSVNQSFSVNLHRITNDVLAESTVSWYRRNVADASTDWASPGGDFNATLLSSISANPTTWANGLPAAPANASSITFVFASSTAFVATAQAALDGNLPLTMLLVAPGAEAQSGRAILTFASDDPATGNTTNRDTIQSQAPLLTIDYTPIPEPSSVFLFGIGFIGLARHVTRSRK